MRIRILAAAAVLAAFAASISPVPASTDPDTPTTLHGNVVIGHIKKEGLQLPQYFTFRAGPGTLKLRLTLRPNSDGLVGHAVIQTPDGSELLNIGDGTSNDKDSIKTGTLPLSSSQTLVLKITADSSWYGSRHATWRVQLDGDVQLNKHAKPLSVVSGS